jgi:hypothetical protein
MWLLQILCLLFVQQVSAVQDFELKLLTGGNAKCLDGSRPGYYISPSPNTHNAKWLILLEGGGWCYSPAQCYHRAMYQGYGSSQPWKPRMEGYGIISQDVTINRHFASFNRVMIKYCDGGSGETGGKMHHISHAYYCVPLGGSFAGDATASFNGTTLWMSGRKILQETLAQLQQTEGLANAEEVLLAGCVRSLLSLL